MRQQRARPRAPEKLRPGRRHYEAAGTSHGPRGPTSHTIFHKLPPLGRKGLQQTFQQLTYLASFDGEELEAMEPGAGQERDAWQGHGNKWDAVMQTLSSHSGLPA